MKSRPVGRLVVVIEDDPLVLEATGGLLRTWGCKVIAAESFGEAMAKLGKVGQRPDLIVCDYRLPQGPNGVDAIEAVRSAFQIPALLISGDASLAVPDDGIGGCRLLHKPVKPETFRAVLEEALLQSAADAARR